MIQQIGQPFVTTGVLNGTMVGGLSGQIISGATFLPEVQVVQISATSGSTSFQILQEDNQAGTVFSTNGTPTTDPYTSDSLGRVQGSTEFNSSFKPVFLSDQHESKLSVLTSIVAECSNFLVLSRRSPQAPLPRKPYNPALVDRRHVGTRGKRRPRSLRLSKLRRDFGCGRDSGSEHKRRQQLVGGDGHVRPQSDGQYVDGKRNDDLVHPGRVNRVFLYHFSDECCDDYDHATGHESSPHYYRALRLYPIPPSEGTSRPSRQYFLTNSGHFASLLPLQAMRKAVRILLQRAQAARLSVFWNRGA